MDVVQRVTLLMSAPEAALVKIDSILEGRQDLPQSVDTRLLSFREASEKLGISRQTLWRMINEGKIPTIEIRRGSRRVPAAALVDFVTKGLEGKRNVI